MDIQSIKKSGQSYEAQKAIDWLEDIIGEAEDAIQLAWLSTYKDMEAFEEAYGAQILSSANGGEYGNVNFYSFYTKIHDAMDYFYYMLGGKYMDRTSGKS